MKIFNGNWVKVLGLFFNLNDVLYIDGVNKTEDSTLPYGFKIYFRVGQNSWDFSFASMAMASRQLNKLMRCFKDQSHDQ